MKSCLDLVEILNSMKLFVKGLKNIVGMDAIKHKGNAIGVEVEVGVVGKAFHIWLTEIKCLLVVVI